MFSSEMRLTSLYDVLGNDIECIFQSISFIFLKFLQCNLVYFV